MTLSAVLIGMPGSGKSTIGARLASVRAVSFVDTDAYIESATGRSLQNLLDDLGYLRLRTLEETLIRDMPLTRPVVIATGGSVVYGEGAMQALRQAGPCIYLKVTLETIRQRVGDFDQRGFSCAPGASLESVFQERQSLYERYADHTVENNGENVDEVVGLINRLLD